jgi:hypothetical protein
MPLEETALVTVPPWFHSPVNSSEPGKYWLTSWWKALFSSKFTLFYEETQIAAGRLSRKQRERAVGRWRSLVVRPRHTRTIMLEGE